jgi:cytoskeletal protein CcmA (bactofilin family)
LIRTDSYFRGNSLLLLTDLAAGGDISATGNIYSAGLTTTGGVSIGGNLTTTGSAQVNGNLNVTGTITAGSINITSLANLTAITVSNNVTTANLSVTGGAAFNNITATGTANITTLSTTNLTVSGNLTVTGGPSITLGASASAQTVNVGTGAGLTTVNIANTGILSNTVVIGNSHSSVGVGGSPSGSYTLQVFGRFKSNSINETSDIRYKKDIKTVDNALSKVLALRGVNYHWRQEEFPENNFDNTLQLGVIAQEVEKIVPEVVRTDEKGFKSVEYSKLVALLIEAIKDQQKTIDQLKEDVKSLKAEAGRVDKLEADMARLKTMLEELMKKNTKPAKK